MAAVGEGPVADLALQPGVVVVAEHSAAMRLLLAGVDITVIALWLGHESLTSTQAYLHADMQQKQEAIGKTAPPGSKQKRYQPPDPLLEFLENL
jgi:integrase/recombinase XerD